MLRIHSTVRPYVSREQARRRTPARGLKLRSSFLRSPPIEMVRARLAVAYAFEVCTAHPLRDGDKRISFLAAVIFLGLNGFNIVAPEDEVVERMLALASGGLDEEAVDDWLRGRITPRPGV